MRRAPRLLTRNEEPVTERASGLFKNSYKSPSRGSLPGPSEALWAPEFLLQTALSHTTPAVRASERKLAGSCRKALGSSPITEWLHEPGHIVSASGFCYLIYEVEIRAAAPSDSPLGATQVTDSRCPLSVSRNSQRDWQQLRHRLSLVCIWSLPRALSQTPEVLVVEGSTLDLVGWVGNSHCRQKNLSTSPPPLAILDPTMFSLKPRPITPCACGAPSSFLPVGCNQATVPYEN